MKKSYVLKVLIPFIVFVFNQQVMMAQVTTQTFAFTGSLTTFTVPNLCVNTVTIDARGAGGGSVSTSCNGFGGLGARIQGVVTVTPGQVLTILVGGVGVSNGSDAGGGGGSFVATGTVPLVVAGGGGGASNNIGQCGSNLNGVNASITTTGTANASGAILGGVNGNGGGASGGSGGGGGGFFSNGANGAGNANGGGKSFLNGGAGGTGLNANHGGFGGGGCGWHTGGNGGGGGGYSGGGTQGSSPYSGGGGGGSFNAGSSQTNTAGFQSGNGLVLISYQLGTPITASSTALGLCSGNSATISANGMLTYTWSTGSNATSIAITPTSTTSYTVQGTNSLSCISTTVITLTVSPGIPTLAINSSTNQTCFGKTLTLTATGANSYTWSNNVINGVSFTPSVSGTYSVLGQNGCGTSTAAIAITVSPLPVTALSNPTVVCAGSASTLTAVSAATSYSWFPIIVNSPSLIVSPQVSTIYTIAVSDGTCFGNATVAVNALPVPTISALPTLTTVCSGVPVNLIASGGISYTWSPGNLSGSSVTVAPNAPTGYQVIGSNSLGCTALANVVIITNPSPTLNIVANSNLICSGDQVIINASGANQYLWDNGSSTASISVSPLQSTTYTLTGTTNSCVSIQTITISVFIPTLAISGPTAICTGESATLTASNASSYLWNNGLISANISVNPSSTTIYSVSASTNSSNVNCPSSASLQLIVKPNPTVTAVATRSSICRSESTTLNASGASSYSWSTGANTSSITVTSSLVTNLVYSVTGTSTNGCVNTSTVQLRINSCTGIENVSSLENSFQVFPNPSNGEVYFKSSINSNLNLYNQLGQKIMTLSLNEANQYQTKIENLSEGLYEVVLETDEFIISKKIIIKN